MLAARNELSLLGLLEPADELLDEVISFLDQFLVGHVELVLLKQVFCLIVPLSRFMQLRPQVGNLGTLHGNHFSKLKQFLR